MENKQTARGLQRGGKKGNKINKTRDQFPDRQADTQTVQYS